MLLAIDIGNTNIKLGLYNGEERIHVWRMRTERGKLTDEYAVTVHNLFELHEVDMRKVDGCAISSVVPQLTGIWTELSRRYLDLEPVVIGPGVKVGMRLLIDTPRELG